jgi:hypothetical protein
VKPAVPTDAAKVRATADHALVHACTDELLEHSGSAATQPTGDEQEAGLVAAVLYRGANLYDSRVDAVEVRKRIGMVFQKPNPFPINL